MKPQELKENLKGVVVIMVTPFKPNLEVDFEGMRKNARFLIDSDVTTGKGVLVSTGSIGQCYSLTNEERTKIAEVVVNEAKGEVPVVAGCNHTSTLEVVELAKKAESVGADGVLVAPPFYFAPSREQLYAHYEKIADAINIGIMIYNYSAIGASPDIPVDLLAELAEIPNIIGIKDCTDSKRKRVLTARVLRDKISVINGSGEYFEPYSYMMGTRGFISATANYLPKMSLKMYEALLKEDFKAAKEMNDKIFGPIYFEEVDVHEAMNLLGLVGGTVRPPLLPITKEKREHTKKILSKIGVFR